MNQIETLTGDPRKDSRFLKRNTPPHILTLVLIAGMGALNMNLVLPSLPAMTTYFNTDYTIMQLAISAYLGMTALFQLIIGPLSDRYGRRPVLLAGFGIFVLATYAAAFSPTIELFMIARLTQATIVSGFALSRAIVRDMVPMEQAASIIGYVTMGMTLIPMVSPAIGGLIQANFGWQANFHFAALLGILTLLVIFYDLQETNKHITTSMGAQFRSYPQLFRSRRFWGFSLSALFASGTFFAFLGGAPYVAERHLGLGPSVMGFFFIFVAVGYMLGNFLSGRFATRAGVFVMMIYGSCVAIFGVLISLVYFSLGFTNALGFFGPLFFVGMGNGMTLPSAMAGIVSVRPNLAGSAAGLGGAIQIGGGAALSVLAGILLTPTSGPAPLLWLMFVAAIFGIAFTLYTRQVAISLEKAARTA